jgi:hypothetical protein
LRHSRFASVRSSRPAPSIGSVAASPRARSSAVHSAASSVEGQARQALAVARELRLGLRRERTRARGCEQLEIGVRQPEQRVRGAQRRVPAAP